MRRTASSLPLLLGTLILAHFSAPALATGSCDPYLNPYGCPAETDAPTTLTSSAVLRTATVQVAGQVSSRIEAALRGAGSGGQLGQNGQSFGAISGQPAGEGGPRWGAWFSASHTDSEDTFSRTAFNSNLSNFLVGIDVSYTDNVVFGLALGYENNDVDTNFNPGEQETDGISVIPYVGILLSPNVSLDFAAGYTALSTDQFRNNAATARVTSSLDSSRYFVAGNIQAFTDLGPWTATVRAGGLYSAEDQDAFTESDGSRRSGQELQLGQIHLGGEVGYRIGEWEPYATAGFRYDFVNEDIIFATGAQPGNDRTEVDLGIGIRYSYADRFYATLSYDTVIERDDFDSDSFTFTLRGEF